MRKSHPQPTAGGAGKDNVFVDTSAWIAFFSARDQNHGEAERLFRSAVNRGALLTTTNLVLAELHRLVLHRAGPRAARLALDRITSSESTCIVFAGDLHHAMAIQWLDKLSGHRLSYADAVGFAVIRDTKCTGFLGFDSHFIAAGFQAWKP